MVITYHGGTFVKVSFGDTTLAFNPISKKSKLKQSKFGSDIALISQNHVDSNGVEQVTLGAREPFIISGPGEYEVNSVTVTGFKSETSHGGVEMINTIYIVKLEGMRLCFLGTLSNDKLSDAVRGAMENIDILFIPIGSEQLEPSKAYQLGVKIGAHIIIPTGYDSESLSKFLKEEGEENNKPVEKLTVKKKDIETMEGEVVVLKN